jgi:xanthine dehydrogenase small subunit
MNRASIRREIRFLLNDQAVRLSELRPERTLLDYLRLDKALRGTKEGCAEGDCGACTVLVGRLSGNELAYEPVNACIRFLGSLDGCHVVTVEHLSQPGGPLHPVQQAMVDNHGSQCGFCTPGFVMALYALWMKEPRADVPAIEKALQGNLCRCTGYESIVRAALAISDHGTLAEDRLVRERDKIAARLRAWKDGTRIEIGEGRARLIIPADEDDLAAVLEAEPEATIVAGATDVGLWVTKQMRDIAPTVFIGGIESMRRIQQDDTGLIIHAGVSYSNAEAVLARHVPALAALIERIGGAQIRHMGTIGGNIANGSPIGDMPPPLIALGAELTLRRGGERRTMALEDFFIDYGRQDRRPGEFVEKVRVPLPSPDSRFAVYKVSKRHDEDITSVLGAFHVRLDGEGRVASARIAYGGMAATPKRAHAVEAALVGRSWNEETVARALPACEQDYRPITDMRATAEYRMLVAKNLLRRFFLETQAGKPLQLQRNEAA